MYILSLLIYFLFAAQNLSLATQCFTTGKVLYCGLLLKVYYGGVLMLKVNIYNCA